MVVDECGAHEFARNALSVPEDERKWTWTCSGMCALLPLIGDAVGDDGRRTDSVGTPKVSLADVDYDTTFHSIIVTDTIFRRLSPTRFRRVQGASGWE